MCRPTPPSSGAGGEKRKSVQREQVPPLHLNSAAERCPADCRLQRLSPAALSLGCVGSPPPVPFEPMGQLRGGELQVDHAAVAGHGRG